MKETKVLCGARTSIPNVEYNALNEHNLKEAAKDPNTNQILIDLHSGPESKGVSLSLELSDSKNNVDEVFGWIKEARTQSNNQLLTVNMTACYGAVATNYMNNLGPNVVLFTCASKKSTAWNYFTIKQYQEKLENDVRNEEEGPFDFIEDIQYRIERGLQFNMGMTDENGNVIQFNFPLNSQAEDIRIKNSIKGKVTAEELFALNDCMQKNDIEGAKTLIQNKFNNIVDELFKKAPKQCQKLGYQDAETAKQKFKERFDQLDEAKINNYILRNYTQTLLATERNDHKKLFGSESEEVKALKNKISQILGIAIENQNLLINPNFMYIVTMYPELTNDMLKLSPVIIQTLTTKLDATTLAFNSKEGYTALVQNAHQLDKNKIEALTTFDARLLVKNSPEAYNLLVANAHNLPPHKIQALTTSDAKTLAFNSKEGYTALVQNAYNLPPHKIQALTTFNAGFLAEKSPEAYNLLLANGENLDMFRIKELTGSDGFRLAEKSPERYNLLVANAHNLSLEKIQVLLYPGHQLAKESPEGYAALVQNANNLTEEQIKTLTTDSAIKLALDSKERYTELVSSGNDVLLKTIFSPEKMEELKNISITPMDILDIKKTLDETNNKDISAINQSVDKIKNYADQQESKEQKKEAFIEKYTQLLQVVCSMGKEELDQDHAKEIATSMYQYYNAEKSSLRDKFQIRNSDSEIGFNKAKTMVMHYPALNAFIIKSAPEMHSSRTL